MRSLKIFLLFAAALLITAGALAQNETLSVIHSRKSVRNFTGVPAGKDELLTLVKAAMAAPTAVDRRPWAFVIVTDKETLKKLAEGMPYTKMLPQAGAGIVVCGVMEKALAGDGRDFWVQDCSAATENLLLAAESMGLGAVWTGVYPDKERISFVRKTLGLPEGVVPLNLIPVGYPAGVEKPKDKFDPANIHWEKW